MNGVYNEVQIAKFVHIKIATKIEKEERVKGFFIFITMISFKQVEYNYSKIEPCKRGCSWITNFLIV